MELKFSRNVWKIVISNDTSPSQKFPIPIQILIFTDPEYHRNYTSEKREREREKDKSETISFRGSSPIVFHDLGRGRCEKQMVGREREQKKRRENVVSQRCLNAVYNADKNNEKKIEI